VRSECAPYGVLDPWCALWVFQAVRAGRGRIYQYQIR